MVEWCPAGESSRMGKRILAGVLWFFSGWYFGAFVAFILGISPILGPTLGFTAAALIAGDPLRVIWNRPARAPELIRTPA